MSFEDPSANTGRFQAFVERDDEDVKPARRRSPVSPGVLVAAGVAVIVIIIVIIAVA